MRFTSIISIPKVYNINDAAFIKLIIKWRERISYSYLHCYNVLCTGIGQEMCTRHRYMVDICLYYYISSPYVYGYLYKLMSEKNEQMCNSNGREIVIAHYIVPWFIIMLLPGAISKFHALFVLSTYFYILTMFFRYFGLKYVFRFSFHVNERGSRRIYGASLLQNSSHSCLKQRNEKSMLIMLLKSKARNKCEKWI